MNYIEVFKNILSIRGLLPNSEATYLSLLKSYLYYCQNKNILPEKIEHLDLIEYIAQIKSDSMKRQTIGMVKTLYEWCLNQGYKCYGLPYPKRREILPEYLTPYELSCIFNSIKNIKQKTILKLQYATAMRVFEVCKIRKMDFIKKYDHHQQKNVYDIRIYGKGKTIREVPVPDETISLIIQYWNTLKEKPQEYLFPGQFAEYYSTRSVQIIMKRAMQKLGIKKYGSTHLLRKSRITHLIQAGVDISFIKLFAGHKRIETLKPYLALRTSDLRVAFNKADLIIGESIKQEQLLLKQA